MAPAGERRDQHRGHRIEALDGERSRLTLTLEIRGFLVPIVGRFHRDLTDRYLNLEAEGMKRAAESPGTR